MIEKAYLNQKYTQEKLSLRQIAKLLEVSSGQVKYWLVQHGIPRRGVGFGALEPEERKLVQMRGIATLRAQARPRKFTLPKAELESLYCDRELSLQQIADLYEVSAQTVLNRLRREAIEVRDSDTAKRIRRRDPEVSRRASLARRGSKSHLWKGGRTALYLRVRTCLKMKAWRFSVFERDNYTCKHCGKRGGTLHADHITPMAKILTVAKVKTLEEAEALTILWDVKNGRTLCVRCHRQTPSYGRPLRDGVRTP